MNIQNTDEIREHSPKRIGAAIVTYNGAAWVEKCLNSLNECDYPLLVAVFDNASTDNTVQIIRNHHPEVALLCSKNNQGFGVGNNKAITYLLSKNCDFILLLNQDAYTPQESIKNLVAFMERYPETGVVTPLHCSPDADHIDLKTFSNYLARTARAFIDDAIMDRRIDHYLIEGINAAAWLIRSEVLRQVGGFDPLFFMYGEDDDLIHRLNDHKVNFALAPGIKVVHQRQSPPSLEPKSFWDKVTRRARRERSTLLLLVKRPGYTQLFRLRLLIAFGLIRPLANWLVDRNSIELFAMAKATWQVTNELGQVARNAEMLAKTGPHFLGAEDTPADAWDEPFSRTDKKSNERFTKFN